MKLRALGIAGCLFLLPCAGSCQDAGGPSSRVARLSYLYGSVSFRPDAVEAWAEATLNYPLATGDRLWTEADSDAEIEMGAATVHMAPQTAFAILYLDDRVFQFADSQGSLNIRIFRRDDGETFEVDTPRGAVTLLGAGSYRIDVSPQGDTTLITVRAGSAEAAVNGSLYPVMAGQTLRLGASGSEPAFFLPAEAPDPWDQWCTSRDEVTESAIETSQSYLPWDMVGGNDLSQYGDWAVDTGYGLCWTPRDMPAEWAPYRQGRWINQPHRGWTWVDNAPWGFAPFHYGRWVELRGHWIWVPEPLHMHPVYTPAAVAFTRGNDNGFVGWIPLGPHETPKGSGRAPANLLNRDFITVVPRAAFNGSRPVDAARDRTQERKPFTILGGLPDVPVLRESVLGREPRLGDRAIHPPENVLDRGVMVRRELPTGVEPAVAVTPVTVPPRERPVYTTPAPAYSESFQAPPKEERQLPPVSTGQQQREEGRRIQEEARRARSERSQEEQRRQQDQHRQAEDQRQQEQQRQAEEQRRQQDERRQAEDSRQQEQQRQAEEQRRQQDERHQAEDQRRQEEQQRQAEQQQRQQEQQRQAEEQRRQQDERRQAEDQRRQQEQQRQAEDQRRQQEQQRQAEDQRRQQQDQQRQAEDQRRQQQDQQRQAEDQRRQQEQQRQADDQRQKDQQRR